MTSTKPEEEEIDRAAFTAKQAEPLMMKDEKPVDSNNHASCSALDLSWLSESVMEAALDTKNLSLSDIHHFEAAMSAAEQFGGLMADESERISAKIHDKEHALLQKMVHKEFVHVCKQLHLYRLLKTHQTWEQVHYMADMHGQGAYILMKDFQGLHQEDVKLALTAFHTYLKQDGGSTLPYSTNSATVEEAARPLVEKKVAAKLCRAYKRLYNSLHDQELGGYDSGFLQETVVYKMEDLQALWGVTNLYPEDDNHNGNDNSDKKKKQEEDEDDAKLLGERTDDENDDSDEDGDNKAVAPYDDDYEDNEEYGGHAGHELV